MAARVHDGVECANRAAGDPGWRSRAPAAGLADAKRRCGLAATAPVRSCYEAGRDAFWPHRLLEAEGVTNVVVDSASIEVSRRARRAKTDRLDARKLVTMLVRWTLGERQVWQAVHVPAAGRRSGAAAPAHARDADHGADAVAQPHPRGVGHRGGAAADHGDIPGAAGDGTAMGWDARAGGDAGAGAGGVAPAPADRGGTTDACAHVADGAPHGAIARGRDGAPADAAAGDWGQRRLDAATEVCSRDLRNRRQVGALTGLTATLYESGTMARDKGSVAPAWRRCAAWRWKPRGSG